MHYQAKNSIAARRVISRLLRFVRLSQAHFISIHSYLDTREDEALAAIRLNLLIANLTVFLLGGLVSYLLAQHTLQPIEDNMAAQSRFVSDASHELRTPLTALLAANEVAAMNSKLTLKQAKQVIADNVSDVKTFTKTYQLDAWVAQGKIKSKSRKVKSLCKRSLVKR